jgi:hypothetical protein
VPETDQISGRCFECEIGKLVVWDGWHPIYFTSVLISLQVNELLHKQRVFSVPAGEFGWCLFPRAFLPPLVDTCHSGFRSWRNLNV